VFEDELIPLFEKCGAIWDLRLMMDPMTGFNRGYSFITYCDRVGANEAVKQVCIINLLQCTAQVEVSFSSTRFTPWRECFSMIKVFSCRSVLLGEFKINCKQVLAQQ
jgi:hypothetical protein